MAEAMENTFSRRVKDLMKENRFSQKKTVRALRYYRGSIQRACPYNAQAHTAEQPWRI